jgi:hypothetical protein
LGWRGAKLHGHPTGGGDPTKKLTTLANTNAEMAKFEKEEATKVAVQLPGYGAVVFYTE